MMVRDTYAFPQGGASQVFPPPGFLVRWGGTDNFTKPPGNTRAFRCAKTVGHPPS